MWHTSPPGADGDIAEGVTGMSTDRAKHEFEDLKGKAKEKIGDATDNRSLQAEGLADQAKAKAGKVGDEVKDAMRGDKR
jgi:uncharacterized protein YjbJ (UPF0337 family)